MHYPQLFSFPRLWPKKFYSHIPAFPPIIKETIRKKKDLLGTYTYTTRIRNAREKFNCRFSIGARVLVEKLLTVIQLKKKKFKKLLGKTNTFLASCTLRIYK